MGDDEGMVDGRDQSSAGLEYASQLGQRRLPVLQVVKHQGRDDIVERVVGVGKGAAQVGHLQVSTLAEPAPGQLQHPDTRIEPAHEGAAVTQRREQGPGAAAGVENPPAGHVPGEGEHRGTLVVGIDEVGFVFARVRLGEAGVVVDLRLIHRHSGRRGTPGVARVPLLLVRSHGARDVGRITPVPGGGRA